MPNHFARVRKNFLYAAGFPPRPHGGALGQWLVTWMAKGSPALFEMWNAVSVEEFVRSVTYAEQLSLEDDDSDAGKKP